MECFHGATAESCRGADPPPRIIIQLTCTNNLIARFYKNLQTYSLFTESDIRVFGTGILFSVCRK